MMKGITVLLPAASAYLAFFKKAGGTIEQMEARLERYGILPAYRMAVSEYVEKGEKDRNSKPRPLYHPCTIDAALAQAESSKKDPKKAATPSGAELKSLMARVASLESDLGVGS